MQKNNKYKRNRYMDRMKYVKKRKDIISVNRNREEKNMKKHHIGKPAW